MGLRTRKIIIKLTCGDGQVFAADEFGADPQKKTFNRKARRENPLRTQKKGAQDFLRELSGSLSELFGLELFAG
jgi:hypothetical protein